MLLALVDMRSRGDASELSLSLDSSAMTLLAFLLC